MSLFGKKPKPPAPATRLTGAEAELIVGLALQQAKVPGGPLQPRTPQDWLQSGRARVWLRQDMDAYEVVLSPLGVRDVTVLIDTRLAAALTLQMQAAPMIVPGINQLIQQPMPTPLQMQMNQAMQQAMDDAFQVNMQAMFNMFAAPRRKAPPPDAALWEKPETVTTEILAFRHWAVRLELGADGRVSALLLSPYMGTEWDGPVLRSVAVPSANGDLGIYGVGVEPRHKNNFRSYVEHKPVWGVVALSGIVAEGDCGYRAEVATIRDLWVRARTERGFRDIVGEVPATGIRYDAAALATLLAERYQCEVGIRAAEWGFAQAYITKQQQSHTQGEGSCPGC